MNLGWLLYSEMDTNAFRVAQMMAHLAKIFDYVVYKVRRLLTLIL